MFLTWELPIDDVEVARKLQINFDADLSTAMKLNEEQVWLNGVRVKVCSATGGWCLAD